jgi:hypothetical protein
MPRSMSTWRGNICRSTIGALREPRPSRRTTTDAGQAPPSCAGSSAWRPNGESATIGRCGIMGDSCNCNPSIATTVRHRPKRWFVSGKTAPWRCTTAGNVSPTRAAPCQETDRGGQSEKDRHCFDGKAAQMEAEPGSSLAMRLQHDEAESAGASKPAHTHCRAQGGFVVNSHPTNVCRAKDASEEIKATKIFAMRTVGVQYSEERGRRGTIAAPSPRTPHPGSDYATVNVLLRHQQKGDISIEVSMGTFLTRLDTLEAGQVDTEESS